MAEYIEREKVYKCLNVISNDIEDIPEHGLPKDYIEGWQNALETAIDMVENIPPAADVRPERHGFWAWSKLPNGYNEFKCSACGAREATTIIPHFWVKDGYHEYCGVCGAKMDGTNQKGEIK